MEVAETFLPARFNQESPPMSRAKDKERKEEPKAEKVITLEKPPKAESAGKPEKADKPEKLKAEKIKKVRCPTARSTTGWPSRSR
ncbi:MAG: hypothetical protein WDO13_18465 [Verrucomicrobiota bacterium]